MILSGRVIGAWVEFFKLTPPPSRPSRNVLCFGITHVSKDIYRDLNAGRAGGGTYPPNWLVKLVENSNKIKEINKTLILLEFPPFSELIELKQIEETITERSGSDIILCHSMKRLRPFFQTNGKARKYDWKLDGSDLRYRYKYKTVQVEGEKKIIRLYNNPNPYTGLKGQSLHQDVEAILPYWEPHRMDLTGYYAYLTGQIQDKRPYDHFGTQLIKAGGRKVDPVGIKAIFAQAAARCRTVYKNVPDRLKQMIIEFLVSKFNEKVQEIRQTDPDQVAQLQELIRGEQNPQERAKYQKWLSDMSKPPESGTMNIIKYGVAEQLMNLYLIGNIIRPEDHFRNVVIVAGDDHIKVIREFISHPTIRNRVGLNRHVSGSKDENPQLGKNSTLGQHIKLD